MTNIVAVTKSDHLNSYWKRPSGYAFASPFSTCPLVVEELPKAALSLPVGFMQNEAGGFSQVAILGLRDGVNARVTSDGKWIDSYIPASLRAFPFVLAKNANNQQILCIHKDYVLNKSPDSNELAFFDEDGNTSEIIAKTLDFLAKIESGKNFSNGICDQLAEFGLIEAWPIKIQLNSEVISVEGLFRVSERKLNQVDPEQLKILQSSGALTTAYLQLLSQQHINALAALENSFVKTSDLPANLDLDLIDTSGNINFDNI